MSRQPFDPYAILRELETPRTFFVVIGGLGSLEGALAGALIVGIIRTLGITYFAEIELAVLYLIAAVVLFVRPAGLFGRA